MADLHLNQLLAIDKGVRARREREVTDLHRTSSNPSFMNGFEKAYTVTVEDHSPLPPERQKVQLTYEDAMAQAREAWSEVWDISAAKDYGNTRANADVVVDGNVIASRVPATFLLTMEKNLASVHTYVSKLVELDPAEDWSRDANTGLHKTAQTRTVRTAKKVERIELAAATEHHPAQVQLHNVDTEVGYWMGTKFSGAIPSVTKRSILERITNLQTAVKQAREAANMTVVERKTVGTDLLKYLFGPTA